MSARRLCNFVESLLIDAWGQSAVDELLRPEALEAIERQERHLAIVQMGGELADAG